MDYILITDSHLGIKKGNDTYIEVYTSFIYEVCQYANDNKIKTLIHCGDFFDTRKSLSLKVIDVATKIMDQLNATFDDIYLIIGNHDTFLKNTMFPHSLLIFKEYSNVHIVDKITNVQNIVMLPWLFDIDSFKESKMDAEICIGHFDINDIQMNVSGYTSLGYDLNKSDFKDFEMVISGHYHMPSTDDHITYLGSPYQLTFNEMGCKHGFYVLGSNTMSLMFHEFTEYPKHVIYKDTDEIKNDIKGNNVKLIFTKDHGIDMNTQIIHNIDSHQPNSLKIDYFNLSATMTDEVIDGNIEIMSKLDIMFDFYDKAELPDGIVLAILKKMTKNMYNEIKGESE